MTWFPESVVPCSGCARYISTDNPHPDDGPDVGYLCDECRTRIYTDEAQAAWERATTCRSCGKRLSDSELALGCNTCAYQ